MSTFKYISIFIPVTASNEFVYFELEEKSLPGQADFSAIINFYKCNNLTRPFLWSSTNIFLLILKRLF